MKNEGVVHLYRATLEASMPKSRKKRRSGAGRAFRQVLSALDDHPATELHTPDDRVLVWSDLHLGHANVIDYGNRPFADVEEMDRRLWDNWAAAVSPETVLVCVGDLAMRTALNEDTWRRVRTMHGRQELVIGNHDLTGLGQLRVDGFDGVWSAMTAPGKPPLILTHMPLLKVPDGHVNVHGHLHDAPVARTPHINVSVEHLDYRPISLVRLRRLAATLVKGHYPPGRTTLERAQALKAAHPGGSPGSAGPGGRQPERDPEGGSEK